MFMATVLSFYVSFLSIGVMSLLLNYRNQLYELNQFSDDEVDADYSDEEEDEEEEKGEDFDDDIFDKFYEFNYANTYNHYPFSSFPFQQVSSM